MATLSPYAFTLRTANYWTPVCFPTLAATVAYIIKEGYSPARCHEDTPVLAHYAEGETPIAQPLDAFLEQIPVDEAPIRVELQARLDADKAAFDKAFPNGRDNSRRYSGDCWLCEMRPEELEAMFRREVERRSWRWKELS